MLGFSTGAADELAPLELAIARLEIAMANHPDDPDLEWAYANALARAGRFEQAADQIEQYATNWPTRRKDTDLAVGRMLFDAGRVDDARPRLQRAVRANPESGTARFFLALALRKLGQKQQARFELIRSGALAPDLLPDSTLLLSIDAFADGNEKEGIELARRVLEIDPTSDAAARARILLRDKDLRATERPFRIDGYVGFDYDDNVTLTANKDDNLASDEKDIRGNWGLGLGWRQGLGDRSNAMLGYRFDQAQYNDLNDFNFINNTVYVSGLTRVHPQVALRLDLIGWNTIQDGNQYLWAGSLRPAVLVALPRSLGLFRLFANIELREFDDEPFDRSVEQDGWTYGAGLEWSLRPPKVGGLASIAASYTETQTDASTTTVLGDKFKGDYDQRSLRVFARARIPLWWSFELGGDLSYSRHWYKNKNFINFLDEFLTSTTGDFGQKKRNDHVVEGRLFLARPLHRFVTLEVEWKRGHRMSNIGLYDYERQVVGMVMRVQSD